jgi:cell division protease FtsH
MVCEFGMSELGPLAFRKPGNSYEQDRSHVLSQATAERVDDEIRKVIMNAYDRAKGIIEQNSGAVRLMAEALLEQESLEADEIKELLANARTHADARRAQL